MQKVLIAENMAKIWLKTLKWFIPESFPRKSEKLGPSQNKSCRWVISEDNLGQFGQRYAHF